MSKSIPERVSALETDMDNIKDRIDRLTQMNDLQLTKLDRISRLVWMAMGAVLVIQAVATLVVPHLHK